MSNTLHQLRNILTPSILLAVYDHHFPWPAHQAPSGAKVGPFHFDPDTGYLQKFYNLIFHNVLIPLSKIPLQDLLLAVEDEEEDFLRVLLPSPTTAADYPQQCLGLILILDQQRMITEGYSVRYTHSFFDPMAEKLARRFISLSAAEGGRPDSKNVWLSRGFSFDDWVIIVLWFWGPLVHSDKFMVEDREMVKEWLHGMRREIEDYTGERDPYEKFEEEDDEDVNAFQNILKDGTPTTRRGSDDADATVSDYGFWWVRVLNSHFAITDMCGHYPFWIRNKGLEWTDKDREFMEKTGNFLYDPEDEPLLEEIREDYLKGVWKPMVPTEQYEHNGHWVN